MTATMQAPSSIEPRTRAARSTGAQRTLLALVACALGALPLKDLFRDFGWLFAVWASMLIVIAPAMLLRLRRDPEPWHVWPGLVLLVPWLTLVFVPKHAWMHIVPTTSTWHDISKLLTDLHHTTAREVAPIHSTPAVRLVLCAMLGLLAALVDLIAVVGRRGALAGVPLLVVFTVAGAVPKRTVSWPLFVIGAIGFLLLLALDAEDDRREWGKRIPRPGRSRPPSRLGVSAQRVGVIAIIAALALPLVLPTHSGNLLTKLFRNSNGSGQGFGTGGGNIDPFVALKGQLVRSKPQSLFTVQISSRPARAIPFYARVNVLSDFTGTGWMRSPTPGVEQSVAETSFQTSPPTSVSHGIDFKAEISISGLAGNPPVFDRPTQVGPVGADTRWSETDLLLVGDGVSGGEKITEGWQQPSPTVAELTAAPDEVRPELQDMVQLPANMPTYVVNLVTQLTAGLNSPYAKARAISDYFTSKANGFTYSLSTKTGDSGSELVDFLQHKQGFCQQYAAAMGVMLRLAGVPARIVLGYTHPNPDKNASFVVTTNDAHSWVEAYFEGIGWVPFDPTPLAGIDGGSAADLPWAPHPKQAVTSEDPGVKKTNSASSGQSASSASSSASAGTTGSNGSTGSNAGAIWTLGVLVLLVGIALVPAGMRQLRRRGRIARAAHRGDPDPLWAELADTAVDLGYVWSPARTPRQVATWLRPHAPTSAGSLDTLVAAVESARYAPAQTPRDVSGLSGHLATVSRELRSRRSGRTRFLSRFWPASLGLAKHVPRRKR